MDAAGNPIPIQVFEHATVGVEVGNIGVDNGSLVGSDLGRCSATRIVASGVTTVTFTNVLEPPSTTMVIVAESAIRGW